jgi:hypothetical protein
MRCPSMMHRDDRRNGTRRSGGGNTAGKEGENGKEGERKRRKGRREMKRDGRRLYSLENAAKKTIGIRTLNGKRAMKNQRRHDHLTDRMRQPVDREKHMKEARDQGLQDSRTLGQETASNLRKLLTQLPSRKLRKGINPRAKVGWSGNLTRPAPALVCFSLPTTRLAWPLHRSHDGRFPDDDPSLLIMYSMIILGWGTRPKGDARKPNDAICPCRPKAQGPRPGTSCPRIGRTGFLPDLLALPWIPG